MSSDGKREDTKTSPKWFGMNKILAGIAITVVSGLILALTGWNFAETAAAPSRYADKTDNQEDHRIIKEKIDRNQEVMIEEIKETQRLIIKILSRDREGD